MPNPSQTSSNEGQRQIECSPSSVGGGSLLYYSCSTGSGWLGRDQQDGPFGEFRTTLLAARVSEGVLQKRRTSSPFDECDVPEIGGVLCQGSTSRLERSSTARTVAVEGCSKSWLIRRRVR